MVSESGLKKTERNSGIDLLRLVSMFMVVFLHVLYRGGVLATTAPVTGSYCVAWGFETAVYCAVNCYGLISGYVGYRAKFRVSNLVFLWCRVLYYTLLIMIVFAIAKNGTVGKGEIIGAFFPICTEQYWYFTAYAGMFFFIPILNLFINKAEKKQLFCTVVASFVFLSLLPTIFRRDIFYINAGYSAAWLAILYLIGGCIAKYRIGRRIRSKNWLGIYLLCVCVSWGVKIGMDKWAMHVQGYLSGEDLLISYTSPTILIAGVSLLIAFSRIRMPEKVRKWVEVFTPLSFSVYLIHFHPLVKVYLLQNRFVSYVQYGAVRMALLLIGTVSVIFVVCLLLDFVREFIFRKIKLKERLRILETNMCARFKDYKF